MKEHQGSFRVVFTSVLLFVSSLRAVDYLPDCYAVSIAVNQTVNGTSGGVTLDDVKKKHFHLLTNLLTVLRLY